MELKPNDLIIIKDTSRVIFDTLPPNWVREELKRVPVAVVRRAPILNDSVPIGIRGTTRCQRQAGMISFEHILRRITPENLVKEKSWNNNDHLRKLGIADALDKIDNVLSNFCLTWGPVGGVGFELASGDEAANKSSDIDIVIIVSKIFSRNFAKQLEHELNKVSIKLDIQLEMNCGAFAFAEIARGDNPILLRTDNGPILVQNSFD